MSQSRELGRLTKELGQASEFRKSAIDAMRQATTSVLATCATVRGEMARDYRRQVHKFLASLTRDVAAHRRATTNHVAQTRKFLSSMAKDVAARRNATMQQIARLTSARLKATSQLQSNLQRQVGAIMEQTRNFRNVAASASQKMAKQQRMSLDAGHRKLHANMTKVLGAIHADRMKGHEIWSAFRLGGAA
jgi:hypothetical protein